MRTTSNFVSTIVQVNKIGRSYGFRNGSHWAEKAVRVNEINQSHFVRFKRCSEMFTQLQGIPTNDLAVSPSLVAASKDFLHCISSSQLRNMVKQEPKLPAGTFRAYIKEFHWKGIDGEPYNFKFSIVNKGDSADPHYTIYINDAPHFSAAQNDVHRFHILGAFDNPYICWDTEITAFDKANAVMIVWAQNYKKELDEGKKRNGYVRPQRSAASRRHALPHGTFRNEEPVTKSVTEESMANMRKVIYMEKAVMNKIMSILGKRRPELGGMLGFSEEQDLITHFVFDKYARVNRVEYNPDIKFLDAVLNERWSKENICLAGFVHSHPGNFKQLSGADVEYAARICKEFDMEYLFMPIVTSSADSKASITGYIVTHEGRTLDCDIEVVDLSIAEGKKWEGLTEKFLESTHSELESMARSRTTTINPLSQHETFARIATTIPLEYMEECTVVGIGCGGARGFYEDMARCGVGKFFLIDGDISSRSNIASQNGYISEIGKPKVSVVKARLCDINDRLKVLAMNQMLDDSLTDEDFGKKLEAIGAVPEKTVICAFTDSFEAQARCQRLAKAFRIPLLAAQHHANGDSSEVIYWYPGVSRYSQEEILADRYEAYANGFKNDVTSVGSPIFNTTRLNALCEKIALGMLLYKSGVESRYTSFMRYNSDRNLILIRQKCLDFSGSTVEGFFRNEDEDHFDDVVWLNPKVLL